MNDPISKAQQAFIAQYKKQKKLIIFYRILILVTVIALWELITYLEILDPFIFSSPSRVANTFVRMLMNGSLFYHVGITLFETIISFVLGTIFGVIIAIILWWNEQISKTLEPYLVVLNSLPKTALAPILIVWLGYNLKSIIIIALTVSIIITILNVYNGFINVDEEKIKLIYTFKGSKMHVLQKVIIPSNFPTIISTMKVNIGLSLIGVIIGEFLVAQAGLGYLIVYGSQVFKLDWVMMSIIILALLATALYELIVIFEQKVSKINNK